MGSSPYKCMKTRIAIIVRTVNIKIYPFAADMAEGNFLIKNFNDLTEEDYGKQILVEYDPQDPFCTFKEFYTSCFDADKAIQDLQKEADEKGITESCLDGLVHDTCSKMASDTNNGGREEQIKFLVTQYGPESLTMIRESFSEEETEKE